MDLGGGVAFRTVSDDLDLIRRELSEGLHGLLSAQDSGGWRPHVTIQNKVMPHEARALKSALQADFLPRPIRIEGLAAWRYHDGAWEPLSRHVFRS